MANAEFLVAIHSHATHRLNMRRLLSSAEEFQDLRLIFIERVFEPPSWLYFKNRLKSVIGCPDTFLVSRASENGIIDGYAGRVVAKDVRHLASLIPNIKVVAFGELVGEVSLLGNQLATATGARLCLVPEGTGVFFEDVTAASNRGVGWKLALERGRFQRKPSGLKRRGRILRLVASIRSIQKSWWRVRRQFFLRLGRPSPPALSYSDRVDYLVSDWVEHMPKGFSASKVINPTSPGSQVKTGYHDNVLFLHAPYDFSTETWLSCLEAIDVQSAGSLVLKRHRIPTGFANLVEAANLLKLEANVLVVERGVAEEMFVRGQFGLVAGVDSTALFAAANLLPGCPTVSVLDTLQRIVTRNEAEIVKHFENDWNKFRNGCVGRVRVV